MNNAVEMHSVTLTYRTDGGGVVTAVDAMSLVVPAGQVIGLLGPSGAGKTSVLRVLAGRVAPTAGLVLLNGRDPAREPVEAARQVGAMIDGEPAVDLAHPKAPILVVDELAWSDDRLRSQLERLCTSGRERAKTVVLATRDTGVVRSLCDRAAVVDRGRLVNDLTVSREADLSHEAYYRIEVKGRLDACRASYFEGLDVRATRAGTTTISGIVADQAALHGLLASVRDLALPLLSVERSGPDLEAVLERLAAER